MARNRPTKPPLALWRIGALVALRFASRGREIGLGVTLWLLFVATWMQPLHLAQEVHALLPASAQHHALIHCETGSELVCERPNDDVSQPLSGLQHERHHEAKCSTDSHFAVSNADVISAAPQGWDISALDFAVCPAPPRLAIPALPKKSRAPPLGESPPLGVSLPLQSGRAPPISG